jgi:hypothetical protein
VTMHTIVFQSVHNVGFNPPRSQPGTNNNVVPVLDGRTGTHQCSHQHPKKNQGERKKCSLCFWFFERKTNNDYTEKGGNPAPVGCFTAVRITSPLQMQSLLLISFGREST